MREPRFEGRVKESADGLRSRRPQTAEEQRQLREAAERQRAAEKEAPAHGRLRT